MAIAIFFVQKPMSKKNPDQLTRNAANFLGIPKNLICQIIPNGGHTAYFVQYLDFSSGGKITRHTRSISKESLE